MKTIFQLRGGTWRKMLSVLCILCCCSLVAFGQKKVSGTVKDAAGEPVIGANVVEKGTTNGISTDDEGNFTLTVKDKAVLQISYIGFVTQDIAVGNQTSIAVTMLEDAQKLDEVIVVGYGSTSRRNLTTSVSTIDASKMKDVPVTNITNALAGRAAGLIVTKSGGGVNNKSAISIRGGGTPIVVIDGFVMPYRDFENLNSDDIESMTLLKDASSAAVYGARAGDGVIVVKTKGGKQGLNVEYSFGRNWSQPTYIPEKMGSYDKAVAVNGVRALYNMDPVYTAEEVEKYRTGSDPYNYPNTDWYDLILRDFAPETNHALALRGGNDINKYYVSFKSLEQESMYKENSNWMKRYTITMNESSEFKNIGLKLDFGTLLSKQF
jgi:TonB-linked SusC/RagA family outer membrane protein